MIYAVIDTNVLVSALITHNPKAATAKVVRLLLDNGFVPLYDALSKDDSFLEDTGGSGTCVSRIKVIYSIVDDTVFIEYIKNTYLSDETMLDRMGYLI